MKDHRWTPQDLVKQPKYVQEYIEMVIRQRDEARGALAASKARAVPDNTYDQKLGPAVLIDPYSDLDGQRVRDDAKVRFITKKGILDVSINQYDEIHMLWTSDRHDMAIRPESSNHFHVTGVK